jgi:hypothetical protein
MCSSKYCLGCYSAGIIRTKVMISAEFWRIIDLSELDDLDIEDLTS